MYIQHKELEDEMDSRNNYFLANSCTDLSEIIGWYETPFHKDMGLEQTIITRLRNGSMSNIVATDEAFYKVMKQFNNSLVTNFINN